MKIISIVGNRPQFIKEAMVHKSLLAFNIPEIIVHSGQHYDVNMSDIFFSSLGISTPDYFLKVGAGSHSEVTAKVMVEFEKVVREVKPTAILVYGDTNTTLAGALVAAKEKIPLAHVEAGIRMKPKTMPEEINRVVTDRISDFLFCPCEAAVQKLKEEKNGGKIYMVGDVHYDLFVEMKKNFSRRVFDELGLIEDKFILVTLHREANVDDKDQLKNILDSLKKVSRELEVVFPIHPRAKKRITEFNLESLLEGIRVIEPADYLDLMGLVLRSRLVVTDSGGLQKEAYFAGKRALVLLEDPGWRELVDGGWNKLCEPSNLGRLVFEDYSFSPTEEVYGDGSAAKKIAEILGKELR